MFSCDSFHVMANCCSGMGNVTNRVPGAVGGAGNVVVINKSKYTQLTSMK